MGSRIVDNALQAVGETRFRWNIKNMLEIENAFIFWTNFRGEANAFGNKTRSLNVAVTPEVGAELEAAGWRVRQVTGGPEDKDILYFVNVKVNMQSSYPPAITLFSEFRGKKSRRALDIDTVGELDRVLFDRCDLIVKPFESDRFPGKVTGYLNKLNAVQEKVDEFGGFYDDWAEDSNVPHIDEE